MWISKSDLIELGVGKKTIERRLKAGEWRWRYGKRIGPFGTPPIEIELSSLPSELQFKYQQLQNQKRAIATASSAEPISQGSLNSDDDSTDLPEHESISPPVDERLDRFAAALARFCAPEYTIEQREAVQANALRMAEICNQVLDKFKTKGRIGQKGQKGQKSITVKSPGSREAGKDRTYHPEVKQLARQTACADAIYSEMYPSSKKALSPGTLLKLTKEFRESGLVAFVRERQTLRPEIDERFLEMPQEASDWLRKYFESYSSASVSRFGQAWMKAMKRDGVKLPFTDWRPGARGSCYAWLYRWWRRIPQVSMILATGGQLGLEAKVAYIKRRYDDVKPREIWTMDWKQLDVCYWLPAVGPGDSPKLVREWLCPTLDVASRAPFGFAIQDRPNARGITEAYLDAMMMTEWKTDSYGEMYENAEGGAALRLEPGLELLCGIQQGRELGSGEKTQPSLHLDNGKDFRSYAIDGKVSKRVKGFSVEPDFATTMGAAGVSLAEDFNLKIRNAIVRNAKSKIVEPWFRYAIGLWEETMPGYCGNRPENKPHWFGAAVRLHRAFEQRKNGKPADARQLPKLWREVFDRNEAEFGAGTPFLKKDEFKKRFILQLREYLRSPHSSLKDAIGDVSPLGYLEANADSPHMLSEQTTFALMMIPKRATVTAGEIVISWYGERTVYRAVTSQISDTGALQRLPSKSVVEVRFNARNIGRVLVMGTGSAICWAENQDVMNWGGSEADFKRANGEKKRRDQVAREFSNSVGAASPDWRREVEGRENVIAMPIAVNAGAMDQFGEDEEGSPWGESLNEQRAKAPVAVITRFDRKDGTGTKQKAGLRMVPTVVEDDYDDLLGESDAPIAAGPTDDDDFSDLL